MAVRMLPIYLADSSFSVRHLAEIPYQVAFRDEAFLTVKRMLHALNQIFAVVLLADIFYREAVTGLYVIIALCLYVAALELERAVLYVGFGHRRRVFLVRNLLGGNLLNFLRLVTLRVVLPRVFAADFERDVLHRSSRRKATTVHHAPVRAGRRRKLLYYVCLCPCGDYGLSPFKDYIVVARRDFSLYINRIALTPDRLSVFIGELSNVVVIREVSLFRVVVHRTKILDLGFQIMLCDDFFYYSGCCFAFKCLCVYVLVQSVQFCFYLDFHLGRTVLTEPRRKARDLT